jgi:hypothetical protein
MGEIGMNFKMVWAKGSMSIGGEIGINYKMVWLGQGFHEHRRSLKYFTNCWCWFQTKHCRSFDYFTIVG